MLKNVLKDLINENNKNMKTLSECQQDEITKNVQYVRAKGISQYESELLRKDLISMYFEREIRNETVDFSDAKDFCDMFIDSCPEHKIEPLLYTLYHFACSTLVFFIFDLLLSSAAQITVSTIFRDGLLLFFIVLSYFVLPRFSFQSNKIGVFLGSIIILCILTGVCVILRRTVDAWVLLTMPLAVRSALQLTFFFAMVFLWRKYNYKLAGNN